MRPTEAVPLIQEMREDVNAGLRLLTYRMTPLHPSEQSLMPEISIRDPKYTCGQAHDLSTI